MIKATKDSRCFRVGSTLQHCWTGGEGRCRKSEGDEGAEDERHGAGEGGVVIRRRRALLYQPKIASFVMLNSNQDSNPRYFVT